MSIFKKKALPQSYQPVLQAQEIIDVFSRLTLHHQAALLRLISRNMVIQVGGRNNMGYEFKYEVDGAVIVVSPAECAFLTKTVPDTFPFAFFISGNDIWNVSF